MTATATTTATTRVQVDVIIPVHNAAATIEEAVRSAMNQVRPATAATSDEEENNTNHQENQTETSTSFGGMMAQDAQEQVCLERNESLIPPEQSNQSRCRYEWRITVCCFDDGSTDDSWSILQRLEAEYHSQNHINNNCGAENSSPPDQTTFIAIPSQLRIAQATNGLSRGAGYARNRAVELGGTCTTGTSESPPQPLEQQHFLCFLDSDDVMHPERVYRQSLWFLSSSSTTNQNYTENKNHGTPTTTIDRTLLGCTFVRDPPDATWHYAQWANGLSDEQLYWEQYRELTLLQPTWMISRSWFVQLGGYIEAPPMVVAAAATAAGEAPAKPEPALYQSGAGGKAAPTLVGCEKIAVEEEEVNSNRNINPTSSIQDDGDPRIGVTCGTDDEKKDQCDGTQHKPWQQNNFMIHPVFDTPESLRLAEDLRFFYTHLHAGGKLALLPTKVPLVTYRHASSSSKASQSSQTSRRLLLQLRVWALEHDVLRVHPAWQPTKAHLPFRASFSTGKHDTATTCLSTVPSFCVWGAGRDAKDFLKALSPDLRIRVACLAEVDAHKIATGYYVNRNFSPDSNNNSNSTTKIPIVHFSLLARDEQVRQQLQSEYLRPQGPHVQEQNEQDSNNSNSLNGNKDNASVTSQVSSCFGRIRKGKPPPLKEQGDGDLFGEKDTLLVSTHFSVPPVPKRQKTEASQDNPTNDITTRNRNPTKKGSSKAAPLLLHAKDLPLDLIHMLPQLPVVVCVARYRTGGALEHNVQLIGRTEGHDLWHVV